MIRAILWKEWHEHRSRFLSYWLVLSAPLLIFCFAIAFSKGARTPFADLSDATLWKYLPLSLSEVFLLETVLTVAAAYLGVAIFNRETEDRSLFFLFEQAVPRKQYVAIKFLNAAGHIVLATYFAALLSPVAGYVMMRMSGKVTASNLSEAFAVVMGVALRAGMWYSLTALMIFSAAAVVAALIPRFWMAATAALVLLVLFGMYSGNFFDIAAPTDDQISVSANISPQWITISRALKPSEVSGFAHWQAWPMLLLVILSVVFCGAVAMLYERKELK